MARKIVSIGMDPALTQAVDRLAATMQMERSSAIRYILRRAIETPQIEALLIEEVNHIHGRLNSRMQTIRQRIMQVLMEELGLSLKPPSAPEEPEREEIEVEEVPSELPALPARGEDIVEGEILEGLGGRGRRKRKR